ncbi:hypothetical protein [Paenibacillus sp. OAS669]|uniref:hypothetical protein n=1 Tax=Paenibacillus sp. OAS669 TaxID=2663821 RepID=UPI00178A177F|nr:hypothetical protein [Paenibacillus sp. OAS669]MBE1442876.1 hypothetical protein [Paenibacillus sp. OAS669]
MLITAFVLLLITLAIGIAAWINFPKKDITIDHKDRMNLEHRQKLKEAVNIEAAQEFHPFEVIKDYDKNNRKETKKATAQLYAVPNKVEKPDKKTMPAVTKRSVQKEKSQAQIIPHKAGKKAKSSVQTDPHKVEEKAKSPVLAVTPKAEEKLKSPAQTIPHKAEEKAKSPTQVATPRAEEKTKSPVHAVPPKAEGKAKSPVQALPSKVEEKSKPPMQAAPQHAVETSNSFNLVASIADSPTPAAPVTSVNNEIANQKGFSSALSSTAGSMSLEKQLDNMEVTENQLQINVYHELVRNLDEASHIFEQINEQVKLVEIMNTMDNEFTKLISSAEMSQ